MADYSFTKLEQKSVSALAAILGLRMIGLFLILPVLALHAPGLTHSTAYLIGFALGGYGLTQALLQSPFGALSDRLGRKPMITIGLLIFALGSVVAAESTTIYGVIIGRVLQGGGAISGVVLAFVGDLTRESQRPKSMAIIGVTIGAAFTLSLMLGPLLDSWGGLRGLFWISFATAVFALIVLWTIVPNPPSSQPHSQRSGSMFAVFDILTNRSLLVLFSGTLTIHALITSLFLVLPTRLVDISNLSVDTMWQVFVPVVLLSLLGMFPLIRASRNKKSSHSIIIIAAALVAVAFAFMYSGAYFDSVSILVFGLWMFFVGFNTLEAIFPSTAVSLSPSGKRGATMGVFNTCTFSGAFLGGVIGGTVYSYLGPDSVLLVSGVAILLWTMLISIRHFSKK